MNRLLAFAAITLLFSTGCLHSRLANHTRQHVQTVVDIQQQQVLDNLARFACNDKSTPFFSVPTSGTTTVGDNNTGTVGLNWNPTTLTSETFGFNKAHTNSQNWTLTPIDEPARLQAMRAAYRYTNGSTDLGGDAAIFQQWFPKESNSLVKRVPRPGWFNVSEKGQVPKNACGVGQYKDLFVWIDNDGLEGLNQMTMAILDLATLEVPKSKSPETQTVVRDWKHLGGGMYELKSVEVTSTESKSDQPGPQIPPTGPADDAAIRKFKEQLKGLEIRPLPLYRNFNSQFPSQIFSR